MRSRMTTLSRQSIEGVLDWINDNPLMAAGVTMATVATVYLLVLIQGAATETGTDIGGLAPVTLSVISARPVYLLAIVVGVGPLVWRE
ncbi:hypothetical protein [Halocatena pleomorpha]|uniref:Uncharacterized protein n=1 Tax=Halocatena pleomorpha TaxID=1785090 RepID=A0A3P3RFB8_9EURY|nr:hypothetical protein [Halocatena pleomorpha]RRJ32054.1 hypothetical protein EIK79_05870 [Halocatena pleomorpha]